MAELSRDRAGSVRLRGRAQVSQAVLDDIERAFRDDPLITIRAAAARAGVGRDTVHQVRRRLVTQATLQPAGRNLNVARNQERFRAWREQDADRQKWRPRQYRRNREVSLTLRITWPAVDGGPAWTGEVSVCWLHRCFDDDPCGQKVNGASAPCRLLIEESLDDAHRPALMQKLGALMARPDYQRRVLGNPPKVSRSAGASSAKRR